MAKYPDVEAGQWITPIRRGYHLACCDCGLIHSMDFRIINGRIQFRAFRDNRSTAQKRRHAKIKITEV